MVFHFQLVTLTFESLPLLLFFFFLHLSLQGLAPGYYPF